MTSMIKTYRLHLNRSKQVIAEPATKFGGNPVFFETAPWPLCKTCSQEMDFLAQIRLDDPINFSDKYTMAYLFMCRGHFDKNGSLQCETWDPHKDTNAVILQSDTHGISTESKFDRSPAYPDYSVVLEHSADADVDISDLGIDEEHLFEAVYNGFKIAGVPHWLRSNDTPTCPGCGGPMTFVAQLDAALDGILPAYPKEGYKERYKFFHFGGDDGLGHLFLCKNECTPKGAAFLWQCT